jgi:hypothetical protein
MYSISDCQDLIISAKVCSNYDNPSYNLPHVPFTFKGTISRQVYVIYKRHLRKSCIVLIDKPAAEIRQNTSNF